MPKHGVPAGRNEQDLWPLFHKLVPGAERLENSISSGMPDIFYPTHHGWFWLELKMRYATYFYLQKYQLAFAVRTMKVSVIHVPHYLVYDARHETCQVFDAFDLLNMKRFPYDEKKLRVEINWDIPFISLPEAVKKLGALG